MGLLDRFRAPLAEAEATVPASQYAALANDHEILAEALGDGMAALRREDAGWSKVGATGELMTRAELIEQHKVCLTAYLRSPLIGRGVRIRKNYCWGGGVEITARDIDEDGDSPVNALLQELLDSGEFKRTLGSAQAREEREVNLHTAGEFFILAVHDATAKIVRPRLVLPAQIVDYITNPDDSQDVWMYKRVWSSKVTDLRFADRNGGVAAPRQVTRTEWHPTLEYRAHTGLRDRVMLIGSDPVRWDQPIQHCAINSVGEAPWGVPMVAAALPWDRAYVDYLGRWGGLMTALARYAFKMSAPNTQAKKISESLRRGQGTDPVTGNPSDPVGATLVMSDTATAAPMHSSGATIDSGSAKPFAGLVAAALDVPVTMLLADPGTTGARAVAETLDKPLEETTKSSQELWVDWQKALFGHVMEVAIEDGRLPADGGGTIDVAFPPVSEQDPAARMEAIKTADDTGLLPPRLLVRLMLDALGVEDPDEVLDDMLDDNGEFVDPRITAAVAMVQRERDGAPGSQAQEAYS